MPRITISYRREDSLDITGRIFDRLAGHFGHEAVFRDIDSIPLGADFRRHIERVLDESDIILAIVGPRWIGPGNEYPRLASPADPVRLEIETALRKEKPLIPVLVSRAVMPRTDVLPDSLHDFVYRHAVQVDSGQDFDVHVGRLIRAIERLLRIDEERTADEAVQGAIAAIKAAPPLEPTSKAEPSVDPAVPPIGRPVIRAQGGHTVRWVLGLVVILGIIGASGWWVLVEQPAEMARKEAAVVEKPLAEKEEQARQAAAKAQVGDLQARLNAIKSGLKFCPSGVASAEDKKKIQDVLSNFIVWLQAIGFRRLDQNVSVCIYSKDSSIPIVKEALKQGTPTSFYAGDALFIDETFRADMSVPVHVYSHHALFNAVTAVDPDGLEIEHALADYLSASFLQSPIVGALRGQTLNNASAYLGSMDVQERGLVWGGALWTCREKAQKQMDQLVLPAWEAAATSQNPQKEFTKRFADTIKAAPAPLGTCFSDEIRRRGLLH
jgi:hypothetical protein